MDTPIKAVVVDDEPLACKRLQTLLDEDGEVELVEVCENGMDAIERINSLNPDLVFLDIQMPEITGFEVLQHLDPGQMPAIIFVTAYDEYAIKAFEVHAVDYLLKPFDRQRFNDALLQAKKSIRQHKQRTLDGKVQDLLRAVNSDREPISRLLIKTSSRFFFIKTDDIEWIESAGNYVRVHSGGKSYLIRDTMLNMEEKLDPDTFFRIHRSTIVNVDKISELEQWFHGDYKVTLQNGEKLTLSRNYKDLLQRFT